MIWGYTLVQAVVKVMPCVRYSVLAFANASDGGPQPSLAGQQMVAKQVAMVITAEDT